MKTKISKIKGILILNYSIFQDVKSLTRTKSDSVAGK